MSYTYADRRRSNAAVPQKDTVPTQPARHPGSVQPTQEQMGRRVDLPDAMREKMESAFGADLSAVKLYESEAVADAGAEAVTRGSDIAFAPGMLDFSSYGGQALLGHEISHVVSQARGEVSQSGGFLNDHALEARADREGAMAAAGQQIAMPVAAMSGVTAAPTAGPMQAKKPRKSKKAPPQRVRRTGDYQGFGPRKPGQDPEEIRRVLRERLQQKAMQDEMEDNPNQMFLPIGPPPSEQAPGAPGSEPDLNEVLSPIGPAPDYQAPSSPWLQEEVLPPIGPAPSVRAPGAPVQRRRR